MDGEDAAAGGHIAVAVDEPERPHTRPRRPGRYALYVIVAVVLVGVGALLPGLVGRAPGEGSVDAGFVRDMSEHHAQAVQMAMVAYRHGATPEVRGLALDIGLGQEREVGVMAAWLRDWGLPSVSGAAPMLWMHDDGAATADGVHTGHGQRDGTAAGGQVVRMPGMATEQELAQLASATGRSVDIAFLNLMIRHHEGGIAMAQDASRYAGEKKVRHLARAMVVVQAGEITAMRAELRRLAAFT
ncbi:DUF305 domain-containing protein [Parafrankia sp. BMG5.11]|nr:DUF305 domain-containing protein [Parafrankia sp. BMG5.11]